MRGLSPIARISISLVLLTLSLVLTGDLFFGEKNDASVATMKARQRLCESLAVQFSALLAADDLGTVKLTLRNLVIRDEDILSAALRTKDGRVRAESGNHKENWQNVPFDKSTLTHTQVPLFKNNTRWGTVEVRFADPAPASFWDVYLTPFTLLAIYISIAGFIAYMFFMKRTLKHLDPGAVIPERVKTALDILTEGVVVVDANGQIVLANLAFTQKIETESKHLMGKELAKLNWSTPDQPPGEPLIFPWDVAMKEGESQLSSELQLDVRGVGTLTFAVNSSPVQDERGTVHGALATFDDVTELVEKNLQLSDMVGELQLSRDEVTKKNAELQILAERDPLTDCLNRRAFFERANAEFESAKNGGKLSIIMMDIDHFKSVNDTYGHGVGDEVIKSVASTLQAGLRGQEVVGRYGGEEFCILLPQTSIEQAARIGERLRAEIEETAQLSHHDIKRVITSSFGVTSNLSLAPDTEKLVDQADQALYYAKENGRNRVARWDQLPTAAAS